MKTVNNNLLFVSRRNEKQRSNFRTYFIYTLSIGHILSKMSSLAATAFDQIVILVIICGLPRLVRLNNYTGWPIRPVPQLNQLFYSFWPDLLASSKEFDSNCYFDHEEQVFMLSQNDFMCGMASFDLLSSPNAAFNIQDAGPSDAIFIFFFFLQ